MGIPPSLVTRRGHNPIKITWFGSLLLIGLAAQVPVIWPIFT
jgi:hypothetical protein